MKEVIINDKHKRFLISSAAFSLDEIKDNQEQLIYLALGLSPNYAARYMSDCYKLPNDKLNNHDKEFASEYSNFLSEEGIFLNQAIKDLEKFEFNGSLESFFSQLFNHGYTFPDEVEKIIEKFNIKLKYDVNNSVFKLFNRYKIRLWSLDDLMYLTQIIDPSTTPRHKLNSFRYSVNDTIGKYKEKFIVCLHNGLNDNFQDYMDAENICTTNGRYKPNELLKIILNDTKIKVPTILRKLVFEERLEKTPTIVSKHCPLIDAITIFGKIAYGKNWNYKSATQDEVRNALDNTRYILSSYVPSYNDKGEELSKFIWHECKIDVENNRITTSGSGELVTPYIDRQQFGNRVSYEITIKQEGSTIVCVGHHGSKIMDMDNFDEKTNSFTSLGSNSSDENNEEETTKVIENDKMPDIALCLFYRRIDNKIDIYVSDNLQQEEILLKKNLKLDTQRIKRNYHLIG